jgi:hypothetical protein
MHARVYGCSRCTLYFSASQPGESKNTGAPFCIVHLAETRFGFLAHRSCLIPIAAHLQVSS